MLSERPQRQRPRWTIGCPLHDLAVRIRLAERVYDDVPRQRDAAQRLQPPLWRAIGDHQKHAARPEHPAQPQICVASAILCAGLVATYWPDTRAFAPGIRGTRPAPA